MNSQYQWVTMLEGQAFFDAVILHVYSPTGMPNNTKPEDFIPHVVAYKNSMECLERRMQPTLDAVAARFPGKAVWITEYGVGGFGGNVKQYTLRYSHLGALHTDLMLMRFIERPSVTIADWHSFDHFFDLIGGEKGFSDREHLTYTHFSLFHDPIQNSEAVVPVKLGAESADIEAVAFTGKAKGYILLINKYGHEYTLDAPSLLSSGAPFPARFVSGVQLLHRTDMPLEKAMQDTERCERVELSPAQLQSVKLPPYSITRLEIKMP